LALAAIASIVADCGGRHSVPQD